MKTIPLTQGKEAVVADEWYDSLSAHKWFAYLHHGVWYAARNIWFPDPTKKTGIRIEMIRMHREIMGCTKGDGKIVDHIDRIGLHNWPENLRSTDGYGNSRNQGPHRGSNYHKVSPYKGVHWKKPYPPRHGAWFAKIGVDYHEIYLGTFPTPEQAALAYNEAALKYHGPYAFQNVVPSVTNP